MINVLPMGPAMKTVGPTELTRDPFVIPQKVHAGCLSNFASI